MQRNSATRKDSVSRRATCRGGGPGRSTVLAPVALALACSVPAAAASLPPFPDGASLAEVSGDERRVWSQGDEAALTLARGGVIYESAATTAYVQAVIDRLFPEFKGHVQVAILKSAQLNAFALPNGRIYINEGLLARFRNEAQLATVLGHEGTHFTHRHGYQSVESVKDSAAFATFGGMVVPVVPQLMAFSSISGFSRQMETEADVQGFARLKKAGYDVHEAPRVFEHLIAEINAEDIKEPFFFASHPRLTARVENMKKLSAGAPPGGDGTSAVDYANRMLQVRIDNLDMMLSTGRAKSALIMLSDADRLAELPPQAQYHVGEAYRLRGQEGDVKLAEEAYLKAIEAAPEFAPSYRALGVLRLKANHYADAKKYLERYIELAPDAGDRKYVESYLKITRRKTGGQP
ncbi:MAG TPA: M48 family metalloprotease [Burkholderiales bacterium]|nr:M48 family metalloprotease [Burkholderiales bacterium]